MPPTDIDNLLFTRNNDKIKDSKDPYVDYCLEQYRIYLHVFNSTNERRQKSNEFFLGLNAAIIGILGYVETKTIPNANIIFMLVPFLGISIGYCWYKIIKSYSQLNKAKFKVIHTIEQKLPITLFETEWHILGKGKNIQKYYPLSDTEKLIPVTFMALYIAILLLNFF